MTGRWLTLDQAARAAHRDRRTIQRWLTQGRVRSHRIAGRALVDAGDVLHTEAATRRAARTLPPKIAQVTGGVVPSREARPAMPTRTVAPLPRRTR